jgi:hypothetical protein
VSGASLPRGFVDASVFLAVYTMDPFFYVWAQDELQKAGHEYVPVTSDLCVGEIVSNIVDKPSQGISVWREAIVDLCERLRDFSIIRTRARGSKCETAIREIIDIQWKDKVWLTDAIHEGACHIYTTDKGVWQNQTQLTKASQQIGGPAVKVHAPYLRK